MHLVYLDEIAYKMCDKGKHINKHITSPQLTKTWQQQSLRLNQKYLWKEFTSIQHTETLPLEFFQWLIAHLQRFEFVIALLAPLAFHENMFDFIRTGYVWIYQFNLWFQSKNMQQCCTKSLFTLIFRVNCKGKPIEFLFTKTWHKKTACQLLMRTLLYSYESSFLILI